MSSSGEAWLDLQELYSSINFLKAKLSATDEKLRAASLEDPIHVDGQGIPRTHYNHPPSLPTSSSQSRHVSRTIPTRMHTTGVRARVGQRESDFLSNIAPQKKQESQSTFVEPVCINTRQTESVLPLWNPSLLGHAARQGGLQGGFQGGFQGRGKRRSIMRATEDIREIIDKQKASNTQPIAVNDYTSAHEMRAGPKLGEAENVCGSVNQSHALANVYDGARVDDQKPSWNPVDPDQQGKEISRVGYKHPFLIPSKTKSNALFNGYCHVQLRDLNSNVDKVTEPSTPSSHRAFENEALLSYQAAKDHKEFVVSSSSAFKPCAVSRNEEQTEKELLVVSYPNTAQTERHKMQQVRRELKEIYVRSQLEEEAATGMERNFLGHQIHMKRKVTLVRKLQGYPGFTPKSGSGTRRKVCRIGKQVELVNNENMDIGNVSSHKMDEAGITKQTDSVTMDGPLGNATSSASHASASGPTHRQLLSRSKSVKRKSQLHVANTGTKVGRYDASAVREYMTRQKLLRKNKDREAQLSSAAQVAAKEKRMRSLFALQRQTAVASAKTGRRKSLSLQNGQGPLQAAQTYQISQDSESDCTHCNYETAKISLSQPVSKASSSATPKSPLTSEERNTDGNVLHCNSSESSSSPSARQMSHNSGSEEDSCGDHQEPNVKGASTQEFRYQPTEQIKHIQEMIASIDRTINEDLARIGCSITGQNAGSKAGDVSSRIRQALCSFDVTGLRDMYCTVPSLEQQHKLAHNASRFQRISDEKDSAARKIQRWFRNCKMRKQKRFSEECISEEDPRVAEASKREECSFSKDIAAKSDATNISFYNLIPEPFTFARAMKLKSLNRQRSMVQAAPSSDLGASGVAFMTSTQSEGKLSPDFSVSTLDGDIAEDEREKRPRETAHRRKFYPVCDDTAVSVTLSADETPAPIQTDDQNGLTDVAQRHSENTNEEVASKTSKVEEKFSRAELVYEDTKTPKPSLEVLDRTDENVWKLLSMQVEAAKAEASRHLGEVHGPSLLLQQSKELTTLLTDSTVAAASALVTSLTTQRVAQNIPVVGAKQQTAPWPQSSSTAIQSPGENAQMSPDEQNDALEVHHETKLQARRDAEENDSTECNDVSLKHDANDTSKSSSEGLEQNSAGLLTARKWERTDTSKKRPAVYSPASTDQESSNMHEQSLSSISDPIILDKQLLSFSSITSSYLLAPEVLGAGMPRLTLLRLQEKSLVQKTRAELAWLEVLKRKCKECGAENKVPALRKKQRGLLLKLHDRCAQLKQMQENESEAPLAQTLHINTTPKMSNATSVSEPSSHLPSLISSQSQEKTEMNVTDPVSALPEEYLHEEAGAISSEERDTSSSSKSSSHNGPDAGALNSSKMALKEWQQHLEQRRKNVQDLLKWQERLNAEETAVSTMERQVVALLKAAPAGGKAVKTSQMLIATDKAEQQERVTSSDQQGEGKTSFPVMEAGTTSLVNTALDEDATSAGKQPFPREHLPSSRGPLIRNPLLSRLKGRRDSSGSEDSLNVSETASEQSDIEVQTLALKEELKKRQLEAARLRKEQRRCHREFLRQKERVLRKHIEMYDKLIEQAKADLEKEKNETISVKPLIKKPVVMEPHRRLSLELPGTSSTTSPSSKAALTHEEQSMGSSDIPLKISPLPSIESKEIMTDISSATSQDIEDEHPEYIMKQNEDSSGETSPKEILNNGIMLHKPDNVSPDDSLREVTDEILMESHEPSSGSATKENTVSKDVELITERSCSISEELHSPEESVNIGAVEVESVLQEAARSQPASVEDASYSNEYDTSVSDALPDSAESDPQSIKSQDQKSACSSASKYVATKTPLSVESNATSYMNVEDNQQVSSVLSSKDSSEKFELLEDIIEPLPVVEVDAKVTENCATEVDSEYVEETVHETCIMHTGDAEGARLTGTQVDGLVNSIVMCIFDEALIDVKYICTAKTLLRHRVTATMSVSEGHSCKKEQQNGICGCMQTCKIEKECLEMHSERIMEHSSSGVTPDEIPVNREFLSAEVGFSGTNSSAANTEGAQTGDHPEDMVDGMSELCGTEDTKKAKKRNSEILDKDSIDYIAKNMVANAVSAVLEIAEEKHAAIYNGKQIRKKESASQVPTVDNCHLSDVSKKLNSILASLEQKRSHRELLRPQDMMILSTDLDEDSLESKDVPYFDRKGENILLSSEESKEEDSTTCTAQPADPLAIESDWFEDDFGLGSPLLAEQYAYPRQIPNKPPPPYSPPKAGSLIAKRPPEATFVIPHREKDVEEICRTSAEVVYVAAQKGENLDLLDWQSAENSHVVENEAEKRSRIAFCEFLFSLTKEVAQDAFCIDNVIPPPWHRSFGIHRKLPLPSNKSQFMDIVSEKVLTLRGVGTRKLALAQLCPAARIQRRKRADNSLDDEVDEAANLVLQREICQEDRQWVDYSSDEVAVKELVADAVLLHILNDTVIALKGISTAGSFVAI